MKKIEAFVKSHRLDEVIEQLHTIDGLTGVSVWDINGFGRVLDPSHPVRIVDNTINWIPHVKIEVICSDKLSGKIVESIQSSAHTGLHGDGKIYVSEVLDAIRISTNEVGEKAI